MMRRMLLPALLIGLLCLLPEASEAKPRKRTRRAAPPKATVRLVWHVETLDGQVLNSQEGDVPINPASVTKVATSLWALERLGPDFRFDTYFVARGSVDAPAGLLRGDLVVRGAGDLDFQVENAMIVAQALNDLGVHRVSGSLVVDPLFWMGWEGGSEGRQRDPLLRGMKMAARLRGAFDSASWNAAAHRTWREVAMLRGLDPSRPPRVVVDRGPAVELSPKAGSLLVAHQSSALLEVLRRFVCHSNNDIERLDATAGPPAALAPWLAMRLEAPPKSVTLQTSSGLGVNRLTPRAIVKLLQETRESSERMGYPLEALLPIAGCEQCTVTGAYKRLSSSVNAAAVAAKTGTLTTTDGGIVVLAGFVRTARADLAFCVAAPRSGRYLAQARRAQEQWLLNLITNNGGAIARDCGPPMGDHVADARVVSLLGPAAATAANGASLPPAPALQPLAQPLAQ